MNLEKTKLSANINKVATLRNARGKNTPDLLHIANIVLQTPVHGLTVHPRPDERHIRYEDVRQLKNLFKKYPEKEFNIEGYPSVQFLDLVTQIQPQQCTLVPDPPDVLTSNAGWDFKKHKTRLKEVVKNLKSQNIRLSLFLDPLSMNEEQYSALKAVQPHRIEFYTESYANSWGLPEQKNVLSIYKKSSAHLRSLGIQVNAGHDLNHKNLFDLLKSLPEIKEVSIGQALIALALEEGLSQAIAKYLNTIERAFA